MLKVYTLGQLRFELDDQPVTDFVSQKAELLFVYLLCHPRPHQREQLAAYLWEDTSTEQSLKNLRTVLSSLQKQFAAYLTVDRQSISIQPELIGTSIWFDYQAFQQAFVTFTSNATSEKSSFKPPRSTLRRYQQALDLYEGEFLSGIRAGGSSEFETWLMLERERLRHLAIMAATTLADSLTEWGEFAAAIQLTYRHLKLDPLSEAAHRRLIRLLAYMGDRTSAMRQFTDLQKMLRVEFELEPEPETLALIAQIKTGRLRPPVTIPVSDHLPATGDGFIARPDEMAQITAHLDIPDCRLVTIAGVGGAGKTRLALQAALERRGEYQHGVYFVSLAAVSSADAAAPRIAAALPIGNVRGDIRQQLLDYLREKHLLLVLDNLEQMTDAAPLVSEIVQSAPYIKLLVTSREPLHLRDEQVIRIDGLPLPEVDREGYLQAADTHSLMQLSAVQLFAQVARRVQPTFEVEAHLYTILRICYLVDGLPLGIEIAAAHVSTLQPDYIEVYLDALPHVYRDVPTRHSGIRALMTDLWAALNEDDQRVMISLAVFTGDFDLAAALAVSEASPQVIARLVNKSLLQHRGERYDLHQIIGRFAREQAESAEPALWNAAQERHHAYYLRWLESLNERDLPAHLLYVLLEVEYHNLWTILQSDAASESQRLYVATELAQYWRDRSFYLNEGIDLLRILITQFDETTASDDAALLRCRALQRLGALYAVQGRFAEAREVLEKAFNRGVDEYPRIHALTLNTFAQVTILLGEYETGRDAVEQIKQIYEAAPDKSSPVMQSTLLLATSLLGYACLEMGDYEGAERNCRQAEALAREQHELRDLASILNNLGLIAQKRDQHDRAYAYYSEAVNVAREINHRYYMAVMSNNLGTSAASLGKYAEAYVLMADAAEMGLQAGNRMLLVYVLDAYAVIAKGNQRYEIATTILGAQARLRDEMGIPVIARDHEYHMERVQILKDMIGVAAYQAAYDAGYSLSVEQAIQYARRSLADVS